MWKGTHPIAPSGRELAPKASEGASGGCSFGLLMVWYLLITADTLRRFNQAVASNRYGKWDSFGEAPTLAVELAMYPLAPSDLGLRPKPPPSRREV